MTVLIIFLILISAALITYAVGSFFVRFSVERKPRDPDKFIPESERNNDKSSKSERLKKNREEQERRVNAFHEKVPAEHPELVTPDGLTLRSSYYRNDRSHLYVILVHGYTGSRKEMQSLASVYHSWGFNVLTPDNRAHGESDGKYIGMGWLDKDDIELWMKWIAETDRDAEIVLHGISMGGATVMMVSGDNPSNLSAVVEDCGYTSVWDIFSDELRSLFHLPSFPVLYMCSFVLKLKAGYTAREASSIRQLEKALSPMLFIHGSDDHFVRTSMLDENFAAKAHGDKERLLVEGAAHAESEALSPELYYGTVKSFLKRHLQGELAGEV